MAVSAPLGMASRMSLLKSLCRQVLQNVKRPSTSVSFLLLATCTTDNANSKSDSPKQLKLLDQREMTHEALIKQACTLTTNSSSQLLTQVLIAISDASQEYRKEISELMVLLDRNILLISNSDTNSLNDVEDLIVEQRLIVDEQQRVLLELISFMSYVEKMVTSTAETAYLAGAEQSSTLMCERLNSALDKIAEECAANKRSEEELLRLQEEFVVQLGELYSRAWKNDEMTEPETVSTEEVEKITPIDIFENPPNEGTDEAKC